MLWELCLCYSQINAFLNPLLHKYVGSFCDLSIAMLLALLFSLSWFCSILEVAVQLCDANALCYLMEVMYLSLSPRLYSSCSLR